MKWYRNLVFGTVVLTFLLIMFGAFVRLADAGLGCPDWPGCYGKLTPIHAKEDIAAAVQDQGGEHGPVSMRKAWKEMGHRYVATGLGLLIVLIALVAVRKRALLRQSPALALALVGVVIFQGMLGMWTVTLLLKPAIVTLHLIGGLLTFALLVWLWQRQVRLPRYLDAEPVASLKKPAQFAIVVLCAQIFLGGWTSTNYAALACQDLPTCQGQWWPTMNFRDAFHFFRELGMTADGEYIPFPALTAIHFMHRVGAIVAVGGHHGTNCAGCVQCHV
jgi:heme a synthase